jgi:hypothetical protein
LWTGSHRVGTVHTVRSVYTLARSVRRSGLTQKLIYLMLIPHAAMRYLVIFTPMHSSTETGLILKLLL